MKIRSKATKEAIKYQPGMEDGYTCYGLDGSYIGYFKKGEAMPRAEQKPVILTGIGFRVLTEDDWIITMDEKTRKVLSPEEFEQEYEVIITRQDTDPEKATSVNLSAQEALQLDNLKKEWEAGYKRGYYDAQNNLPDPELRKETEQMDMVTYNKMIEATKRANEEQARLAITQKEFLDKGMKDAGEQKLYGVANAILNGVIANAGLLFLNRYPDEMKVIWKVAQAFVDAKPVDKETK